jgi:hypothetical protein
MKLAMLVMAQLGKTVVDKAYDETGKADADRRYGKTYCALPGRCSTKVK